MLYLLKIRMEKKQSITRFMYWRTIGWILSIWNPNFFGRGKGHFPRWYAQNSDKIIFTVGDCDLEEFLKRKGVAHKVAQKPTWSEYKMIEDFYGNKIARRSSTCFDMSKGTLMINNVMLGVHLINHIDEGLYILNLFGASEYAKRKLTPHTLSLTLLKVHTQSIHCYRQMLTWRIFGIILLGWKTLIDECCCLLLNTETLQTAICHRCLQLTVQHWVHYKK